MLLRHIYALVSDESLHKSNKNESFKKSNNLKLRNQYSKKIAYVLKKTFSLLSKYHFSNNLIELPPLVPLSQSSGQLT